MFTRTLFCAVLALVAADPQPRVPVLLELFTSEGCSSCPPADKLLSALDEQQPIEGAELIVISEHVDYWNQPLWSDPYSSWLFTQRQRNCASYSKTDDIYTPQLIIDGRSAVVGSRQADIATAIRKSISQPKLPLQFEAERAGDEAHLKLHIDADAQHRKNAVFLVLAADRVQNHVGRGENAGRDLSHVAVAYSFSKIGKAPLDKDWTVPLKPKFPVTGPTRVILFVQDQTTGQIFAIAHARL